LFISPITLNLIVLNVYLFIAMHGEADQACQYCEDHRPDLLATLVPKTVDPNTVVFVFLSGLSVGPPWTADQTRDSDARCRLLWSD
jgi:hypothetical protein